ncbi:hypothetical protein C8Q78DRAFT_1081920 [Trametes maxima]|nr:hypothetical protein C8Q78DRAFT_1081920 [Trametes maxima]
MPEPIVFYDIPGKTDALKAWSPNTWKTRYSLNYKGLPYKTVWVEYPDIEAVLRKLGAPATEQKPDGSPYYTLPAIYDPNTKTAVVDSFEIARYLDKTYPDTPRLIPAGTDALHVAFIHAWRGLLMNDLGPLVIPAVANSLRSRSEVYFRATREVMFGGDLEKLAPAGSAKRVEHWKGIKNGLDTLAQWIEADGTGKRFFNGDQPAWADIAFAGYLIWLRVVLGVDSQEWKDLASWDGGRWGKYLEALAKYESVDEGDEAVL